MAIIGYTILIIVGFIVGIYGLCVIIYSLSFPINKVKGEHNVIITAVEKTPVNTKIYAKTEGESSQEDVYCVRNDDMPDSIYENLQSLVRSKKNIILQYDQEYRFWLWQCGDVVSISEI